MSLSNISDDQKRRIWYNNLAVKFEIVKALRHKELMIIRDDCRIRWLNVQHVKIWDSVRSHLYVENRPASLYMSLDYYKMIPLMSFNLGIRAKQYDEWAEKIKENMTGQDFGLDLDNKKGSWVDVIPDNKKLRDLFNSFGVRFANWMSGSHGFHFIIPYDDMPDEVKALDYPHLIAFYKSMAALIKKGIKTVDDTIYMATRVFKCPYTIEKHGRVIWPLDDKDFEALARDELILDPIFLQMKKQVKNRGIYLQGDPEGIKKFIKEWEGF